jgi:Fuc2NAc and GlcNAc transferase
VNASIVSVVVLGASFLFVGLLCRAGSKRGWVDVPGQRSSHPAPTPTGGGLGLVGAIALGAVIVGLSPWTVEEGAYPAFWNTAVILALGLSLIGFRDDLTGVPAVARFLLQLLASSAMLSTLGLAFDPWWFAAVLALTWTMNAYNFMDGSHGMAGLQGAFSGVLLAVVFAWQGAPGLALAAAAIAAACIGFLPWNFPRARCFMGDAGSVPLGFLLGSLCFAGVLDGALSWLGAVLVLAVFFVDAGLTLLGRLARGERWYTAHREHVYQRLIAKGWSHTRVALMYLAINVVIIAPAVLIGTTGATHAEWIGGAAVALIVIGWVAVSSGLGGRP